MNYFLLLLAFVAGIVALLYGMNIIRVGLGLIRWASTAAMVVHILVAPTAGLLAFWLFRIAVGQ